VAGLFVVGAISEHARPSSEIARRLSCSSLPDAPHVFDERAGHGQTIGHFTVRLPPRSCLDRIEL
jgi:hypothetical protein